MKIEKEVIREDHQKNTYWSRIHFQSEDGTQKSTVLVCASYTYLSDLVGAKTRNEIHLNQWYEDAINKWTKLGNDIFKNAVHYDAYANFREGVIVGLNFLKNNVTP